MEALIDEQTAKRRNIMFYSFSGAIYVIFTVCVISSLVKYGLVNVYNLFMQITLVTSYGLFLIIYIVTLIKLIKAMNRLIASDLKNERRNVITQFSLMLASFASHFIFFVVGCVMFSDDNDYPFWWQFTGLTLYVLWYVLPISYILRCHYLTYSSMVRQRK